MTLSKSPAEGHNQSNHVRTPTLSQRSKPKNSEASLKVQYKNYELTPDGKVTKTTCPPPPHAYRFQRGMEPHGWKCPQHRLKQECCTSLQRPFFASPCGDQIRRNRPWHDHHPCAISGEKQTTQVIFHVDNRHRQLMSVF